jgi:hypothetical protein
VSTVSDEEIRATVRYSILRKLYVPVEKVTTRKGEQELTRWLA